MADVAQLVRALVCGTRCREFESHLPPHKKTLLYGVFFLWMGGRLELGRGRYAKSVRRTLFVCKSNATS